MDTKNTIEDLSSVIEENSGDLPSDVTQRLLILMITNLNKSIQGLSKEIEDRFEDLRETLDNNSKDTHTYVEEKISETKKEVHEVKESIEKLRKDLEIPLFLLKHKSLAKFLIISFILIFVLWLTGNSHNIEDGFLKMFGGF